MPFADERSAQVIARVRGGRGRSMLPPDAVASPRSPPARAPSARRAPARDVPRHGKRRQRPPGPHRRGASRARARRPGAAGRKSGRARCRRLRAGGAALRGGASRWCGGAPRAASRRTTPGYAWPTSDPRDRPRPSTVAPPPRSLSASALGVDASLGTRFPRARVVDTPARAARRASRPGAQPKPTVPHDLNACSPTSRIA